MVANNIYNSLIDILKINIFTLIKTDNPMIDMIITTALIGLLTTITNALFNKQISSNIFLNLYNNYIRKTNSIIIEGKRCIKTGAYSIRNDQLFGNRFRALWHHINVNIMNNSSIYSIKEYAESANTHDMFGVKISEKDQKQYKDIYVVKQPQSFVLAENIYCKVSLKNEEIESGSKLLCKIETISICIFSYKKSLGDLQSFIDKITNEFMTNIEVCRWNKRFIYTLDGKQGEDDRNSLVVWDECLFQSSRTFDNLFFDHKNELIDKLMFFENNRDWYEKEGHPYTFGLALYGPPGTGKTSVIKCIANLLNRHLIVIPLNKIKTQREFSKYYFENQYNNNNRKNSINFENKIIVLDDIDCMTDLIHSRNSEIEKSNNEVTKNDLMKAMTETVIIANKNKNSDIIKMMEKQQDDDAITLSYILNIIDGIRETPGRILIITSNYYNKIDEALRRPGRIDYPLEMKNASKQTICDMYKHYYGKSFPKQYLDKINDGAFSPAQIVNIRLKTKTCDEFINTLVNI